MALFFQFGLLHRLLWSGSGGCERCRRVMLKDCLWQQSTSMPGCVSSAHSAVLATGDNRLSFVGGGCCPLWQWCGVVSEGGVFVVLASYSSVQGVQVVTCGVCGAMWMRGLELVVMTGRKCDALCGVAISCVGLCNITGVNLD